jgi:hypothetical protein
MFSKKKGGKKGPRDRMWGVNKDVSGQSSKQKGEKNAKDA